MKVSIDRFEGQIAVCEMPDGSSMNIEKSDLPKGAKEGDILDIVGKNITINVEETKARKETVAKLVKELFG